MQIADLGEVQLHCRIDSDAAAARETTRIRERGDAPTSMLHYIAETPRTGQIQQ